MFHQLRTPVGGSLALSLLVAAVLVALVVVQQYLIPEIIPHTGGAP